MRNNLSAVFLITATFFAPYTSASAADNVTDELSRIGAETTLLKAKAKQIEVQAAIATKQAELDRLRPSVPAQLGLPSLLAVDGIGKRMYATLAFENQGTLEVKEGDVLPNGMKVVLIKLNEVILESKKGGRARLSYGAPATSLGPMGRTVK